MVEDTFSTYEWDNFMTIEPYIGFGAVVAPTSYLQCYGGLTMGVLVLVLGSDYDQDATSAYWVNEGEAATGVSFGVELGTTFFWNSFGLDLRYKYVRSGALTGEVIFPDEYDGDKSFGHHGLLIGLGFMF